MGNPNLTFEAGCREVSEKAGLCNKKLLSGKQLAHITETKKDVLVHEFLTCCNETRCNEPFTVLDVHGVWYPRVFRCGRRAEQGV